jgi:hypothetical protein
MLRQSTSPFRIGLALAALSLATVSAADARDKDGFLEPAENPLLGTWLLSAEGINPNMPIRCGMPRMTFTQVPRTYIQFRPNAVAAGQRVYTILDHDHIMLDEIPRCTYQRGPLDGTTPLLDSIKAEEEAKRQSTAEPPVPPAETVPPAASPPITSPELQRSMNDLDQAIRELQERARQQAPQ